MITQYISILILILHLSNFAFGADCIPRLEVELWEECYNIQTTTKLHLSGIGIQGEIPVAIGGLYWSPAFWTLF